MRSCQLEKHMFEITPFDTAASTAPLAALHAACFNRAWDAGTLSDMLASPGTFAFANVDGFVMARMAADEAEILTLAVRPAARGRGLGRALLQAAINKARDLGAVTMFLEVGADNPHALALYAGLGFAKVGARKAYYDGRDAAVLRLSLASNIA
jgi:[ribosomal protein S18]-alanine N-acetyltransferase